MRQLEFIARLGATAAAVRQLAAAAVLFFVLVLPGLGQDRDAKAASVLACDRAVASPTDKNRPVGVPSIDPKIAIQACREAAAAAPENPRILFQLGRAYDANVGRFNETGRGGLAADEREAARLYKQAADQRYAPAEVSLGFFYETGRGGLPKDDREAVRLYQRAAEQGNAQGQNNLGHFYETGRGGLTADDLEAARLYQRAAEQGNAFGQNNLGRFYLNGRGGLPQNDREAGRLYRLAAEQGNGFAQNNLGFLYQIGRGGFPQDDAEAARLYGLAAKQGVPDAQNRLAMFYEEGLGGLPKNIGEAIRLYKIAAEQDREPEAKGRASDALTRLGAATAAVSPSAPLNWVQAAKPVIGILNWGFPDRNADYLVAFRQGLAKAGYVEGRNTAIEYRWANMQSQRQPALAMDLAQRGVALIVTFGNTSAALAAKAATSEIPIVTLYAGDPVKDDLVASLNHPGRNITGVTDLNTQLGGKRLGLLSELVPEATTVGFLAGGANWQTYEEQTSNILAAARAVGREVIILQAPDDRDYEAAFATLVQRHAGALVVGTFTFRNPGKILALAARYKIPAIYPGPWYVKAGGLMGYFADFDEVYRQIGIYTGRILKGAKPADLPVVQPTKFNFVVNLKTAKALGIDIPAALLATADEVVE
jgi:putative ABC transport system substrate-binding protein